METTNNKSPYVAPAIDQICIDNEISLILVSGNPGEPVANNTIPEYFNNEPFDRLT